MSGSMTAVSSASPGVKITWRLSWDGLQFKYHVHLNLALYNKESNISVHRGIFTVWNDFSNSFQGDQ